MASKYISVLFIFTIFFISAWTQNGLIYNYGSHVPINLYENDMYMANNKLNVYVRDKVQVHLYYECLCPDCREFDTGAFKEAIIQFGDYLDIHTYPYGNAKTIYNNGRIDFQCQHGPAECYGNKLHACALDVIQNKTQALLFNSCMMDNTQSNSGSDDLAANRCAYIMNLNPEPIKSCAKGNRGTQLLYYFGEESKKMNLKYVPYILVNGKESDPNKFIRDICDAFASPPPQCLQNWFPQPIVF